MLSEELNRINNSVIRIRNKLNVKSAPIEDVARAVETYSGETDIYKVATLEDRDTLNVKEGDMCVVHGFAKTLLDKDTTVLKGTLYMDEDVITADEAITSSVSLSFRDAGYNVDVRIQATSTYLMVRLTDYLDGYKTYQTRYDSTDGITYTYTSGPREIPISSEVTKSGTSWHDIFSKLTYMGELTFNGLYQYLDGAWDYAKIGMNPSPSTVFSTSKYYSDTGIHQGTFIRAQHKENYLTVSPTEPENKTKLWFKPLKDHAGNAASSSINDSYIKNYIKSDIPFNQALSFFNSTIVKDNSSDTGYAGYACCVVGDYFYTFHNTYNSSNVAYKFNISTGARSTVAKCPYSGHSMWDGSTTLKEYNGYIYAICTLTNSSGAAGIRRYSISSNSWSTINTTDYGFGTSSHGAFMEYNDKWYIFHPNSNQIMVFTPSSNSVSVKALPSQFQKTGFGERPLFQDGSLVYFESYYVSGTTELKNSFFIYDMATNTVTQEIEYDRAKRPSESDWISTEFFSGTAGNDYCHHIYDGSYVYMLGTYNDSPITNNVVRLNMDIVKEAFANNDAYIIFKKQAAFTMDVAMAKPYIPNSHLHTDGYLYAYSGKVLVKYRLEDLLKHCIPHNTSYSIVFDTSDNRYSVEIGEKERIMFNDIYITHPNSTTYLIQGNTYIYDEDLQEYRLLIENVPE